MVIQTNQQIAKFDKLQPKFVTPITKILLRFLTLSIYIKFLLSAQAIDRKEGQDDRSRAQREILQRDETDGGDT